MEEQTAQQDKTCGCTCELCQAGKHNECQMAACTWHNTTTQDAGEGNLESGDKS